MRPWLLYVYHKRHHVICSLALFYLLLDYVNLLTFNLLVSSSSIMSMNHMPTIGLVENKGVEPLTPSLQS